MDKDKALILLVLTLAVVALVIRVESGEPAFKQAIAGAVSLDAVPRSR